MKIEFLHDGSDDSPLIRMYPDDPVVSHQFFRAFERLADGSVQEVSLTDMPGVEPLDGCRLIAQVGRRDKGVVRKEGNEFSWVLTPETWDNVAFLIESFCNPGNHGYKWLQQSGDIQVLISRDGCW